MHGGRRREMSWQVILVLMLLGHLVADYTLQGWLADGKQESWWKKVCSGEIPHKYKYDYIAALVCHAIYWSIFECAPFYTSDYFLLAIILNAGVHAIVDDLKANRRRINLIQDQMIHLIQILLTFAVLIILEGGAK
jgi:hypothetical protein